MNYIEIKVGGKLRPVRPTYAMQLDYELATGRNAEVDLMDIANEHTLATIEKRLPKIPFHIIVDLCFAALTTGARAKSIDVDFERDDVAEWVGDDPKAMESLFSAMARAFFKSSPGKEDADDDPKKKKTPRATGGMS